MLVIPAIDLKNGRCVRLLMGRADTEKAYSDNPVEVALRWEAEGAKYLHIVDLDGAFEGIPVNFGIVKEIIATVDVPIELGGGIRDMGMVGKLFSLGVNRVILGTAVVEDPELLRKVIDRYGSERIVAGIDAVRGAVAVRGWKEGSGIDAVELAMNVRDLGITRVIYTDIMKDGALSGPNLDSIRVMAEETGLKVIASGGISTLEDVRNIAAMEGIGVEGMIVGKALYEGIFSLSDAISECQFVSSDSYGEE